MRPECVVPENQCAIKRKEKKAQKEKDKATTSGPVNISSPVIHSSTRTNTAEFFKSDYMMSLMKCDPPLHQMTHLLSENILLDNKNKNIPHLTQNQMSVIYKLIWYQDGYEQPSEEDLKRIEEVRWFNLHNNDNHTIISYSGHDGWKQPRRSSLQIRNWIDDIDGSIDRWICQRASSFQ